MITSLKYLTNEKGQRSAVIVPIKTWNESQKKLKSIQKEIEIISGIRDALHEIKSIKLKKKKLPTLSSVLNES